MNDLAALLARIEAAEEPSRDLYWAVAEALVPEDAENDGRFWSRFGSYTGNSAWTDAMLVLVERVLPGWDWLVRTGPLWACVWQPKRVGDASFEVLGRPPALALCAAVVRAEIERRGEKP